MRVAEGVLDVIEGELIGKDHPILRYDSVIVTPHIWAYAYDTLKVMGEAVTDEIVSYVIERSVKGVEIVVMPKQLRSLTP
uniref:D-isomer specific 2-hydroxyacid dehydrogenase NAD-binding domain-containing protein n=1 Tax=Ignisphaera aggregans TaxID=334771 RepID=A0A7J3Z7R8_9CREN